MADHIKPLPAMQPKHRVGQGTKHKKLLALKCFEELKTKILEGCPIKELAIWIQDDRREYTEITRDSLIMLLHEYRASIPPAELISKRLPRIYYQAEEKLKKGMNALEELQRLYELQMTRIKRSDVLEERLKYNLNTTVQEIRTAREILSSYADLQMDLGLTDRHLGKMEVDTQIRTEIIQQYGSEAVAKVMTSPESRQRVLSAAKNLLQMASKFKEDNVIDGVTVDPKDKGSK